MLDHSSKLVSVIMTAYNSEKYIKEAIESVFAQSYTNIEIICVDDGSTDATGEILKSYRERITFLSHDTNKGIATGRNTALAHVHGEFIAFIDADDIWRKDKLEIQMRAFREKPTLDIVFGKMNSFVSPELSEEEKKFRHCPSEPIDAILPSSACIRKEVFDNVGIFDPKWRVGEFIDWMAKAKDDRVSFEVLPQVLFDRRIHQTNTGITQRPSRVDYVRIARAALLRKRSME